MAGPAAVLAERIAAVSAPPMAASGFQVGGLSRLEGCLGVTVEGRLKRHGVYRGAGQRCANGRGCRPLGGLGWAISFVCAAVAGVQVFNLTKSLP